MCDDLEKIMVLVNTSKGVPNFMLALALCAYTEYWGSFVEGDSGKCFEAFFAKLGRCYAELLKKPELISKNGKSLVYHYVRCGLAHAYMVKGKDLPKGTCGLEYDSNTNSTPLTSFRISRILSERLISIYLTLGGAMKG